MRRMLLVLLGAMVGLSLAVHAQEFPSLNMPPPPNSGVRGGIEGLLIPAIPGSPFSGKLVAEINGVWTDGTTVHTSFFNLLARDSQGRVHQERRHLVPAGSGKESYLLSITILDPEKHERIACEIEEKTCKITTFFAQTKFFEQPEGPSRDGKSYLTREKKGTEILGDQQVERTLETVTVNAGAEGNDRPLVSTREFWYSPTLKINLALKRVCACGTVQDLKVTDLRLTEPDAAMFTPPDGFTMVDLRPTRVQQLRR